MPHVEIKCFSGRTEEQKRRCAEKIAEDISEILVCDISSVSVAIKDVDEKNWKEEVWDTHMIPQVEEKITENRIVPQVGEQFEMASNKVFVTPWGHVVDFEPCRIRPDITCLPEKYGISRYVSW